MSLIRQIVLLLVGVVLLALLGSVGANLWGARASLSAQLRVKNADNAAALALALSQQRGDRVAMELLMAAQFDTGHYRRIAWLAPDGGAPVFTRVAPPTRSQAPGWFRAGLPIDAPAGLAQVSDGWKPLGQLEVESQASYAYDALWLGAVQTAAWLGLVGLAAAGVAWLGVRALRRPLAAMVAQADALQEGRFVTVPVPRTPELRSLGLALNTTVARLRSVFETQAQQVEQLRQQAERDSLTGCANRRPFIARLDSGLAADQGRTIGALVMVRVQALDDLNRRVGRGSADAVLRVVADSLQAYEQRVEGSFVGRLNGADFALVLPLAREVTEVAQALMQGLKAVLPALGSGATVCLASADLTGLADASHALAAVDDALAQAETAGPFQWAHRAAVEPAANPVLLRTEAEWRAQILQALGQNRATLAHYPVVGRDGTVLHLECPLRLRLGAGAAPEPAAHWLSHALRSRLGPLLDQRALTLALAEVAADGRDRSVNIALDSLATAGFVSEVRQQLLGAAPAVRQRIWLELPERAVREQPDLLRDAARQWGDCGACVGVEHAGGAIDELGRLYDMPLRFVKIDRLHVDGIAENPAVRQFASSLLTLLRGMGLQVMAEGVRDPADLAALWALGFDGATGPAVQAQR